MAKKPVKSTVLSGSKSLWLLDFKTRHQPVELLPGDWFYFGTVTWPLVLPMDHIKPFIQEDVTIRFTQKHFYPVASFATEKIDGMTVRFCLHLIQYNGTQTIDRLSHIGVSGHNIYVICKGDITKHGLHLPDTSWHSEPVAGRLH